MTVTWNSVPEKLYVVEVGANLTSWFVIGSDFPATSYPATSTTIDLNLGSLGFIPTEYFLRVRVR